jgi:hypothetical protein
MLRHSGKSAQHCALTAGRCLSLLPAMLRRRRLTRLPMLLVMLRILLLLRSRCCSAEHSPMERGRPMRRLSLRSKYSSDCSWPKDSGTDVFTCGVG